jgi:alkylation response protein AidB-like acyl-CoA dehydrogenase
VYCEEIKYSLADSWINSKAARLMTYQAARLYHQGQAARDYTNTTKYLTTKATFKVHKRTTITHLESRYVKEHHVERYPRKLFQHYSSKSENNLKLH